ncbi:MAG TPA: hypothetical protein VF712_05825 [Thermoleophilaceae bacterium]|jgi:hypothetical protein
MPETAVPERRTKLRAAAAARPDLLVLGALLAAGLGLRLWLVVAWRPAFLGFPDSYGYLLNSDPDWYFADGLRPMGYPLFLAAVRALSSELTVTVLLQHAMGIAGGLCAYAAARAFGAGRWAPLLPAAVLLLHGSLVWLEHGILTEGPFSFLVCAALLPAALAAQPARGPRARAGLAALAGLVGALAVTVRPIALPSLALLALWAAWALPGGARERLAAAAALAVTAGGLLGANLSWANGETGRYSFARHEYYAFYGRIAPFADCRRFDPPEGTDRFCPTTPPRTRPGPRYWVFESASPLVRSIGRPSAAVDPPDAHARVNAFSRAAALAQPGDYLRAVGRDLVRLVDPDFPLNPNPAVGNGGSGGQPGRTMRSLPGRSTPRHERATLGLVARLYSNDRIERGRTGGFETYERVTRLDGVPWLVLLALALAGPFVTGGRERRAALMLLAYSLTLTVAPVALHSYDWRFQLVALGPLAMASAFGLGGLAALLRRRQRAQG